MERYEQYPAEKLPPELNLMADHFFFFDCLFGGDRFSYGWTFFVVEYVYCLLSGIKDGRVAYVRRKTG